MIRIYWLPALLALIFALPAQAIFNDNNDGTVTDGVTGLMWDKCTWGQSANDCSSGAASTHTWQAALGVAVTANGSTHKGYSDWRLPSRTELESLVKIDASSPAIDGTAFPNTPPNPSSSYFWSSTTYAPDPARAWVVGFDNGFAGWGGKTNSLRVRLVRSGQSFDSLTPAVTPTVTSVTPTTATLDTSTIFTVQGTNLATGMGFAVEDCDTPDQEVIDPVVNGVAQTSGSTQRFFQCTPRLSGTSNVTVKVAPGGSVVFTSAAPATANASPVTVYAAYRLGDPFRAGTPSVRGVAMRNGNYFQQTVDMAVPAKGISFELTRSYNSRNEVYNASRGGVWYGAPWRFGYDLKLGYMAGAPGGVSRMYVRREDGSGQIFYLEGGNWYSMEPGSFDLLKENADHTFTFYTKGNRIYQFKSLAGGGLLDSISDRDGNILRLTYNAASKVSQVTDAANRVYTFTYDAYDRLVRVDDFSGRNVRYTYTTNDSFARIATFTDVRGGVTSYTYDANNQLASIADPRGNQSLALSYDASGRVLTLTDPLNRHSAASGLCDGTTTTVCFSYGTHDAGTADFGPSSGAQMPIHSNSLAFNFNLGGQLTQAIDYRNYATRTTRKSTADPKYFAETVLATKVETPRGIDGGYATNLSYVADGSGNLDTLTDPLGQTRRHTWQRDAADNKNLLTQYTSEANNTFGFGYTASGHVQTITDPRLKTTTISYNGSGLVSGITDPNLNAGSFAYDANGNLLTATDAYGKSVSFAYDSLGRVSSKTDKRGNTTSYTYDAQGNKLSETDALSNAIQFEYDANGNLTRKTDARGHATTYVYDALNRLTSVSDGVGGQTYTRSFTYDAMNRVQTVTNENGHAGSKSYDEAGNLLQLVDPLSHTLTYTYDKDDNVLTVSDAEGRSVTKTYDNLNRVTTVTEALGNRLQYSYTPDGKVSNFIDAKGRSTQYAYDAAGNLTSVTDSRGQVTSATYDGNGNMLTVVDPNNHTTTYTYDKLNRPLTRSDANGQQWATTYDDNGNVKTRTVPGNRTTTYTYDVLNRVTRVDYPDASVVTYTYDANGNRLTMTDSTGTTSYTYDALNRMTGKTDPLGKTVSYAYDGVGNVTTLGYPGAKAVSYAYDAGERLVSLTDWLGKTTSYTLNRAGQVTAALFGNNARAEMVYDAAGRLTSLVNKKADGSVISSHVMTLDGNGNITNSAVQLPLQPSLPNVNRAFTYDNANRLATSNGSAVTHDTAGRITGLSGDTYSYNDRDQITGIAGSQSASHVYNGDGHRVTRNVNGQTTRFVIDPNRSLPEVLADTDNAGTVQRNYVYGYGLVEQIDSANAASYYHFDPTGSTLALTSAGGTVSDSYAYTPYGETTASGGTVNPFRFIGKLGVMDDGNGLHYMRARYYRPDVARFMSLDALAGTMDKPQSLNRYAYVLGNPVTGVDPSGKKERGFLESVGMALDVSDLWCKTLETKESGPAIDCRRRSYQEAYIEESDRYVKGELSGKNLKEYLYKSDIAQGALDSCMANLSKTKPKLSYGQRHDKCMNTYMYWFNNAIDNSATPGVRG